MWGDPAGRASNPPGEPGKAARSGALALQPRKPPGGERPPQAAEGAEGAAGGRVFGRRPDVVKHRREAVRPRESLGAQLALHAAPAVPQRRASRRSPSPTRRQRVHSAQGARAACRGQTRGDAQGPRAARTPPRQPRAEPQTAARAPLSCSRRTPTVFTLTTDSYERLLRKSSVLSGPLHKVCGLLVRVLAPRHRLVRSLAARPGPWGAREQGQGRAARSRRSARIAGAGVDCPSGSRGTEPAHKAWGARGEGRGRGWTVQQDRGGAGGGLSSRPWEPRLASGRPDLLLGMSLVGGAVLQNTRSIPLGCGGKTLFLLRDPPFKMF